MAEIAENVYLDAARADVAIYLAEVGLVDAERAEATARRIAARPDFRAAVKSAYAGGYDAGRSDGYGEGSNHGYQEGSGVRDW